MAFEKFRKLAGNKVEGIRINRTSIIFGKTFVSEHNLQTAKAVSLFFDNEERRIGFEFLLDSKPSSYKLQTNTIINHEPVSAHIPCPAAFFKHFDLHPDTVIGDYTPKKLETKETKNPFFYIQLRKS